MAAETEQISPKDGHLRTMDALGGAIKKFGWRSAKGIIYLTAMAMIVNIAGVETMDQLALPATVLALINGLTNSAVIRRLVDSVGGDLLANVISQVANRESVSNQQILRLIENHLVVDPDEIQSALQEVIENEKLLTKKDYYHVVARQQRDRQEQLALLNSIHERVSKGTTESPSVVLLANQVDQFAERITDDMEQQLANVRELWREGKRRQAHQQLHDLISDDVRWEALTRETKARVLCFMGNAALILADDIDMARQFADQAHQLKPLGNEARLRALIAYNEGSLHEAIQLLEGWEDADSIHLRAALYLEIGDLDNCWQLLNLDDIVSDPTAETFRLRTLCHLRAKEISLAQLEIKKAIELNPTWESVRFTNALIGYYDALSLSAFASPLLISAEPVDWILVKHDDGSMVRLRQAAETFQELADLPSKPTLERLRLLSWTLACLANDVERQEQAKELCEELLNNDPSNPLAISWALARNYRINLKSSETALKALVADEAASVQHVQALVGCLFANEKIEEASNILERTYPVFREHRAESAWLLAFTQVQILSGSPEVALSKVESYDRGFGLPGAQILALEAIARKTGNWQPLYDYLDEAYKTTENPNFLLSSCEFRAQQQDWQYVAVHAETLLQHFTTAEVLKLVAMATFNAEHYSMALDLLDGYRHIFPESKLPNDLRHMRILCQDEMGTLPEAIKEAEDLVVDDPSLENLLTLANLHAKTGDLKGLAIVARQLSSLPELPAQQALQIARLIHWEDHPLAVSLWEIATSQVLPEHLVGEALVLGFQLGASSESLKPLFEELQKLGKEGRGGVLFGPASELIDLIDQGRERGAQVEESYRMGKLPVHFVVQHWNVAMALLFHHQLTTNERSPDPHRQIPLLARHGGRLAMEGFPSNISSLNLHLDITSVLLAEHLGILSNVERVFAPLHVPSELIPALVQMREQVTPRQPLRLEENQRILDLVQQDLIQILDQDESAELGGPTLIAEMGREWFFMMESARAEKGYIVDYLPLTKNDLTGAPPSSLPEDIYQILVNCRAIVESLREHGPLSDDEYQRALDALGNEGQVDPSEAIPFPASALYCSGAIPETLAGADLIHSVCENFQVFISRQTYERIRAEKIGSEHMRLLAIWIDRLIARLRKGLADGVYQVTVVPADMYHGRARQIQSRREQIKQETMRERRRLNRHVTADPLLYGVESLS